MKRAALALALFACVTIAATEVLMHVDADPISKARARQLHVRVVSEENITRLDRTVSLFGDPPEVRLPTTVPVVPIGDDATRTFTVSAELIDKDQTAFNKKAATLSFVLHQTIDVDIYFSDLCIGIDCPAGQTCADGQCVDIHTPPQGPNSPQASDAQPGACTSDLCWEQPRPTGEAIVGACLWAADEGIVVGDSALVLGGGIWTQETVEVTGTPIESVACWTAGRAMALEGGAVLDRTAAGWTRTNLTSALLHAIWGASPDDVWAVGDAGNVWRRKNQGAWSQIDPGVSVDLHGVWGSSDKDVYFVGLGGTLLHYDGATIGRAPGPPGADPSFLAVGGAAPDDFTILAGIALQTYDGASWTPYVDSVGFASIAGSNTGLQVGGGGRGAVHFHAKRHAMWAPAEPPFPFDGSALNANATYGAVALLAGDAGALARWNGSAWDYTAVLLTPEQLRGIANDPDDSVHAVAVGDRGSVLERVAEGIWRRRVVGQGPAVKTPDLAAVWMGHGLSVAVGPGGTIVESPEGYAWNVVPSGSSQDLAVVDGSGATVVAAGANGTLLARTAGSWKPFATPIPTTAAVTALRVGSEGSVIAGTSAGTLLRFAGGAWSELTTLPAAITDLRIDPSGVLWVCAGGVYRSSGGSFVTFATQGVAAGATKLVVAADAPSWIAAGQSVFERVAGGTYVQFGISANALSTSATGRFFMAGPAGRILAQRLQ